MNAEVKAVPRVARHASGVSDRVRGLDWERLSEGLDASGNAVVERLLTAAECQSLAALYEETRTFSQPGGDGAPWFRAGGVPVFWLPTP